METLFGDTFFYKNIFGTFGHFGCFGKFSFSSFKGGGDFHSRAAFGKGWLQKGWLPEEKKSVA